jgi:hypothetical protein
LSYTFRLFLCMSFFNLISYQPSNYLCIENVGGPVDIKVNSLSFGLGLGLEFDKRKKDTKKTGHLSCWQMQLARTKIYLQCTCVDSFRIVTVRDKHQRNIVWKVLSNKKYMITPRPPLPSKKHSQKYNTGFGSQKNTKYKNLALSLFHF